ncbi:MAG: glycerophosphodiester phosphodiesterase [Polyangiaceae bacterium]|nr:glycerophosphodiester phosphodiesterase [Polyangiaceae bacterium]
MKLPARPLRPLAALGLALGSTVLMSGEARADCSCREAAVVVMGHRGTGTNGPANPWPENTLPSFEQGVTEGADWIELDVQHSADGALVVLHDETVDRTTDGTGCAGALDLAALAALDAAAGTPLAGTGVTIPTLDEVLAAVDVGVNIEIKIESGGSCPASDRSLLAADVVAAIHADAKSRPFLVSSFDAEVLTLVKALDASVPVGLLGVDPADLAVATSRGFDALHPFYLAVDATLAADVHAAGLTLNAWTVDDPASIGKMLGLADGIISDEPGLVASLRAEACAAECPAPAEETSGCSVGGRGASGWLAAGLSGLGLALFAARRARARRP